MRIVLRKLMSVTTGIFIGKKIITEMVIKTIILVSILVKLIVMKILMKNDKNDINSDDHHGDNDDKTPTATFRIVRL